MYRKLSVVGFLILALVMSLLLYTHTVTSQSSFIAQDPGVRGGALSRPGAPQQRCPLLAERAWLTRLVV